MTGKARPIPTVLLIVSFSIPIGAVGADVSTSYLQERLEAHTTQVPAEESSYAYGFTMRRIFEFVKRGRAFGLPAADIARIKDARRPDTIDAMRPYFDALESRMNSNEPEYAYDLAMLLEKAVQAEQTALNAYYRGVVGSLSSEGQRKIEDVFATQVKNRLISRTNFQSVAADAPDDFLVFLKSAVKNFRDMQNRDGSGFSGSMVIKGQQRDQ